MLHAADRDNNFAQMPFVTVFASRPKSDLFSKLTAKLFSPRSYGLMRHGDTTFSQQILDYPQAQRKPEVQPNVSSARTGYKYIPSRVSGVV